MPKFTITLVYAVQAPTEDAARVMVSQAQRFGVPNGVTVEFESVTSTAGIRPPTGWLVWFEEARRQLLGPRKRRQQPAWENAQS